MNQTKNIYELDKWAIWILHISGFKPNLFVLLFIIKGFVIASHVTSFRYLEHEAEN